MWAGPAQQILLREFATAVGQRLIERYCVPTDFAIWAESSYVRRNMSRRQGAEGSRAQGNSETTGGEDAGKPDGKRNGFRRQAELGEVRPQCRWRCRHVRRYRRRQALTVKFTATYGTQTVLAEKVGKSGAYRVCVDHNKTAK